MGFWGWLFGKKAETPPPKTDKPVDTKKAQNVVPIPPKRKPIYGNKK